MMKRSAWASALAVAAVVGCAETDPDKINNSVPQNAPGATTSVPVQQGQTNYGSGYPGMDQYQAKTKALSLTTKSAPPKGAMGKGARGKGAAHGKGQEAPAESPKKDDAGKPDERKDQPKAGPEPGKDATPKVARNVTLSAEELAEIKKLPAADQSEALAQKVCPIGEDDDGKPNHLGAMGVPVKVTADGKTAYLCCKGCRSAFEKDPAAALAKLSR